MNYKNLEKDLARARAQNINFQKEIDKLQKLLATEGKNNNNTSSSALLPSEFKEIWKELITEKLIDAFANFYDDQHLFILLIQITFQL